MNFNLAEAVSLKALEFFEQRWMILFRGIEVRVLKGGSVNITNGIADAAGFLTPLVETSLLSRKVEKTRRGPRRFEVVRHHEYEVLYGIIPGCVLKNLPATPKRIPDQPWKRPLKFLKERPGITHS